MEGIVGFVVLARLHLLDAPAVAEGGHGVFFVQGPARDAGRDHQHRRDGQADDALDAGLALELPLLSVPDGLLPV